ncbi:MAG: hypothetical protein HQL52_01615 [Magnetococcales bacterium]|nr:hypothetical protein [Magnetococcales bacterium]
MNPDAPPEEPQSPPVESPAEASPPKVSRREESHSEASRPVKVSDEELFPEYEGDRFIPKGEVGNFITDKLGLSGDRYQWDFILYVEALILTIASLYVGFMFIAPKAGTLALFLITGAMTPRMNQILDLNRHHIWVEKKSPLVANWRTFTAIMSIAIGVFVGWLLMGSVIETGTLESELGEIFAVGPLGSAFLEWRFESSLILLGHVVGFLAALLLAFLYKTFGAMLVIVLNVSFWAISLIRLIHGDLAAGESLTVFSYAGAFATFFPHLFFMCAAYVLTCLVAIFLSKGLVRYRLKERRLLKVFLGVMPLALVAFVALAVSVSLQIYYVPWMLTLL